MPLAFRLRRSSLRMSALRLRAVPIAVAGFAGCDAPTPEAPPAPPPTQAPPTQAPPTQAPATAAPVPDAGFTIVAGAPTIVAEAPILSPEARSKAPARAAGPAGFGAAPPPRAAAGESPASPGAKTAQSVIRSHFGDIEACYGAVALKDPSVAGRIVVQWTLGADGVPTGVAITQDTLRSASVTECIRARARTWRFPPPDGGVGVVLYPFDLKVQ